MFETKVLEKIKTHISGSGGSPPLFEKRAAYEIMWKNVVVSDRPQRQYDACALHAG